jgi:UMF1 family MFS transporter
MEKLATVGGTFCFGVIEAVTGSMRHSILAIIVFFAVGLGFMLALLKKERALAIIG